MYVLGLEVFLLFIYLFIYSFILFKVDLHNFIMKADWRQLSKLD